MSMKFNLKKTTFSFPRVKNTGFHTGPPEQGCCSGNPRESALQTHAPSQVDLHPEHPCRVSPVSPVPGATPGAVPGFLPLLFLASFRKHQGPVGGSGEPTASLHP